VSAAQPGRLRERLPAYPQSIGLLRRAVVQFAVACGASERQRKDIAVAVSEALTNVVKTRLRQTRPPAASARAGWGGGGGNERRSGTLACPAVAGGADMLSGAFRDTLWNQTIPDTLRGAWPVHRNVVVHRNVFSDILWATR
jgi:hypothetical protein